ncbi:MAG: type II toxin-antitoxin system RelE/ParE family toxin [Bacillota bacterium]
MSRWRVEVSREAEKALKRQDRLQRMRLREAIDGLQDNPYPGPGRDVDPVRGVPGLWRLRVGDFRVLFTVDKARRVVYIIAVRPRGQAYRNLN